MYLNIQEQTLQTISMRCLVSEPIIRLLRREIWKKFAMQQKSKNITTFSKSSKSSETLYLSRFLVLYSSSTVKDRIVIMCHNNFTIISQIVKWKFTVEYFVTKYFKALYFSFIYKFLNKSSAFISNIFEIASTSLSVAILVCPSNLDNEV